MQRKTQTCTFFVPTDDTMKHVVPCGQEATKVWVVRVSLGDYRGARKAGLSYFVCDRHSEIPRAIRRRVQNSIRIVPNPFK